MTAPRRFSCDPQEVAGTRALVTGGIQGVGEETVRRFAAGGATVATTARSPLPTGQTPDLFVRANVATSEGVERVVSEVQERPWAVRCRQYQRKVRRPEKPEVTN